MLHYEVTKLRKIEKRQFLKSWDFLDAIGMSAMKNDPRWKDFQVSTIFGRGVKVDITIYFSTFGKKWISQFREHDVALRSYEIRKIKNRQFLRSWDVLDSPELLRVASWRAPSEALPRTIKGRPRTIKGFRVVIADFPMLQ